MMILGLQKGVEYKDTSSLRYGSVYICTDSDHDGAHIKLLLVNFFRAWFPSLLEIGYIKCLKTPIVKVHFGKKSLSFFTLRDFEDWKKTTELKNY